MTTFSIITHIQINQTFHELAVDPEVMILRSAGAL